MVDKREVLWSLKKREDGSVYKKIPFATVKAWILEARIDPDDYLTYTGLKKWIPAAKVPELQSYFAPGTTGSDVISSADITLGRQSQEEEIGFDMTPMIDVTFLLLIFFMITATFAIHEVKDIKVPKAKHTKSFKQKENITILIDAQKRIYVGKELVNLINLQNVLKEKVAQSRQQELVLSADKSIDYGFLTAVLDEINGAGVSNIKLKLEKKKP